MADSVETFASFRAHLSKSFGYQCDLFENSLRKELEQLRQQAAKVDALERENESLRSSIQKAAQRKSDKTPRSTPTPSSRPQSSHDPEARVNGAALKSQLSIQELIEANPELRDIFQAKDDEIYRLESAHKQLTEKARSLIHDLHTEREKRSRSKATSKTPSQPTNAHTEPDHPVIQPDGALARTTDVEGGIAGNTPSGSPAANGDQDRGQHPQQDVANEEMNPRSSQSTDSVPTSDNNPQPLPDATVISSDSDIPVVVAERDLKRKRPTYIEADDRGVRVKTEDSAGFQRPVTIKKEPATQSRRPIEFPRTQIPNDSMDLDDMGLPLMTTPQTRREDLIERQQRIQAELNTLTSYGTGAVHDHAPSRQSGRYETDYRNIDLPQSDEGVRPRTPLAIYGDSSDRIKSSKGPGEPMENGTNGHNEPGRRPAGHDVLKPKTPNPRVLPSGTNERHSSRKLVNNDGEFGKIQIVAEDGVDYEPALTNQSKKNSTLAMLLNPPETLAEPMDIRTHFSDRAPKANGRIVAGDSKSNSSVSSSGRSSNSPAVQSARQTRTTVSERRMRERPREQLHPSDFILNPARNEGLDYAYSDVVRRRGDRRCLPNCTKPECCGNKFEKAARLGGYVTPNRSCLGHALRGYSLNENEELIMDYLGCDLERLYGMSKAEKEDVAKKAMAWKFGQSVGKHRHMHERPPSPPGFWRTDMPSTQEEASDRAATEAHERRTVEERYREAMRPGGKWTFRDETRRV